ncbi:MAG: hypothetical protein GF344_09765 [Chitinivibrionales bacterium]|nr:hypothetical protein [Chitinivibrionales bacterium]MBD3357126.1 hypothetical protein [Chitinivibrionales bacterium]
MGFNPFEEKGKPIDKQIRSWSELNIEPYDPESIDPYSRTRGILMNGIEVEASLFLHNFYRHTDDMELRRVLAMSRRAEQQQQKMVNWSIPAAETTLEVTIGYEQLAVDLTATMARREPDPYVKAALDYALIEDFDHLYRYANLMVKSDPKRAEAIVKDLTEVTPGRPTVIEHIHPFDTVRDYYDRGGADTLTKLHVATITAAEQQTMNFYMNVGNRAADLMGRGLYQEIGMIEEQHVSHYGALADPRASWFEMMVLHEYNECYMYYSCMVSESDDRIKAMWQRHLEDEVEHLRLAVDLMKKYEGKDAAEMYPKELPEPLVLAPNKEYVRQIIADQLHFTGDRNKMVPMKNAENPDRFAHYQEMVNGGRYVPSQSVITDAVNMNQRDYRIETEGEHPIEMFRSRDRVPSREEVTQYCLSK